ncbi:MAG: universal stress protein [Gemmatimonadaceae bacterium]
MFKKILVPLDRSALAEQAIGEAALLARGSNATIDLVLVHTPFPFAGGPEAPWNDAEWAAEHTYLEAVEHDLRSGSSVPVTHAIMRGNPIERICDRASDADLIVMTSHGRTGLSRVWLGSVADAIVRRTSIPVLILRAKTSGHARAELRRGFRHILVPIDGSALAGEALGPAIDVAKASGADLLLFRAVYPIPLIAAYDAMSALAYQSLAVDQDATAESVAAARAELEKLAVRLRDMHHIDVAIEAVADPRSADAITQYARAHEIDCIAMSTHGRGGSRLFLGSVADKVLRGSGVAVLLRRPVGVVENYLVTEELTKLPSLVG